MWNPFKIKYLQGFSEDATQVFQKIQLKFSEDTNNMFSEDAIKVFSEDATKYFNRKQQ